MTSFTPANRPIDVTHYKIRIEIDPSTDPKEFPAEAEITLKALASIDSFTLDRDELTVAEVWQVGFDKQPTDTQPLEFDATDPKTLRVSLGRKTKKGEELTIGIRYSGKVRSAHHGLFKVRVPDEPERGPLLFTHFEAMGARAFFPCNDEPYDKATTEIVATVPARYEALSNGKRIGDRRFKRAGVPWREIHWRLDKPHSTYLVALAIGPFQKRVTKVGKKELSVWVGASKKDKAAYSLKVTKQCYEFFEKYLGVKYPWPQYATVGLPTYLWGGMENTTSTHMNEERTLLVDPRSELDKKRIVGLAAHELAHQWFGNYVTMQWWDDLWLNEAFASILGTLGTRDVFRNEEAELDVVIETWDDYMRQEDGPRSHPIIDKGLSCPDDAFDAINYTKGENILRMLSFYVGEAKFRKGLKRYLTKHALGNATYLDFFKAVEQASGDKLAQFRDSWLLQRGYPIISYSGEWDAKSKTYRLKIDQRPNHEGDDSKFIFRLPVVFHRRQPPTYSVKATCFVKGTGHTEKVKLPAEPEWVTVNPGAIVLGKVMPQNHDDRVLGLQALDDPDPIARVWAAFTLGRELLDGGNLSVTAEETLIDMLVEDPSPYVRNAILVAFQRMKSRWLPKDLSSAVFSLAKEALEKEFEKAKAFRADPHGWTQYRSELLGALGKVKQDGVLDFLEKTLTIADLPIDDLAKAARAVATLGFDASADILHRAVALHGKRGYTYKFAVVFTFGAFENPGAAHEIRNLAKTCAPDLMGRLSRTVRDNQTLKNSPEWSGFLSDLVLHDTRFGDEVKARILQTIEDVKAPHVKYMLETVTAGGSDRLKEVSRKILEKNF